MSGDCAPFLTVLLGIVFWIFKRRFGSPQNVINCIPGPTSSSWLYGNMLELLLSKEYGEHEFQWQERYGPVYSIKGCFGESRLMISDPLAAKYVLNAPIFVFGAAHQKSMNCLFGFGNVVLAQAERHRYLRSLMNPIFSAKRVRASRPNLKERGNKLVDRLESLGLPGNTVDISGELHRAILDVVGDAILGPLPERDVIGDLSQIQRSVLDCISNITKFSQLVYAAVPYIPEFVFRLAMNLPLPTMHLIREHRRITDELGRILVQQKRDNEDSTSDDEFSDLFIRRNSTDSDTGVPDEQIPVHLRTILFAGDDTTGGTLGWVLYRLAQMENYQHALREEIRLATAKGKGDPDYDKMPLLNAMINEVLRLYPAFPLAERMATEDCVLPLSQPIIGIDGSQILEIPIKKGQLFFVAIASYNRLASIWGSDALEFRPSRWLEGDPCKAKGLGLGPHASLLSFLSGPAVCPGWRLAILMIQVFVTELVRKFALSLPENDSVRARFAVTLVAKTADGAPNLPIHIETIA
ncbi:cytochrome P450 [Mycena albidolilacea]|uniref:Cytochrome P450 n=1 Tax=Mycena albidolilacea TaxID=1033008 RepID=A0AAD7E7J2_9AGAR|nr:cytochrome P450 [Mycena albidolilacea]